MNHDVFISYSSNDKVAANAICHNLESNNIRCWIAPRDIPPGEEYGDLIDEAIKRSKVFVVIFSEKSAMSQWVKGELNIAFEEQKTIIPFRIDNTPLTGQSRVMLNQRHWIDAYPNYEEKFFELTEAVTKALGKNNRQKETKSNEKFRKKYKVFLGALTSILLICLCFGTYCKLSDMFNVFEYNREGIHVKTNKLTEDQEIAIKSILDNMVLIEGGEFIIGNDYRKQDFFTEQDSLSSISHTVKISNYYIGKYEITQKEWRAFFSLEGKCTSIGNGNENRAVDYISWEDAKMLADTIRILTGINFNLPTEAQWEYAARGGNKTHGYIFAGENEDPDRVGWTSTDDITTAEIVGSKRSNELGLYDMTGNVSEWCYDWYAPYQNKYEVNPQGPQSGMDKVYRGGDYRMENLYDLKVSTRFHYSPFTNRRATGVRLVINIK